ncbi:bifunctional DNA primase/polymerase [Microbacterium sp. No. 7]|uniref:bifunctional DNA primase/polymerase n=1 Tax=Microbacterium sp. No. 7 TaxID=1714373 RepID=UPI0006D0DB95|nr:bifunctional DNA primase/polymerase [Microbacterium sp. No. 7]
MTQEKALRLAALGLAVFPVRERTTEERGRTKRAKTPYTYSGHKEGTTDADQIERWWSRWPEALVGVHAGASGLVALDIDMGTDMSTGEIKDGWNSLIEAGLDDLPQTVTYSTGSGGDHYIYAAPEGVSLGPDQNHVTPEGVRLDDVDRRGGSSYFIWWGSEIPDSRDAFAQAPDWLLTPSSPTRTHDDSATHDIPQAPFTGGVAEWLARCEAGEPAEHLREYLADIAERQGSIAHDEMIDFQRYLVGCAADHLEPGIPQLLDEFRSLYVDFPEQPGRSWAEEFDAGLRGAIEKYGTFAAAPRDIPAVDHKPLIAGLGNEFMAKWATLPAERTREKLRGHVAELISDALKAGRSPLEAAAIGWRSPAANAPEGLCALQFDKDSLPDVWNLTWHIVQHPLADRPGAEEVSGDRDPFPGKSVRLLSRAERASLAPWWGDEYMSVMSELRDGVMSEQYYRANRWIILSLIFADKAFLPLKDGGKIIFNFYALQLGPTKTGKSKSIEPIHAIVDMFYLGVDTPDIGGDATAAGLQQALLARDGKTSYFQADEAEAVLRSWSDEKNEFRGMKLRITDYWGGRVGAMQRSTMKEQSGKTARGFLTVHLTGIEDKLAEAIWPDDWLTGFLNRFIIARGQVKEITREQALVRIGQADGKDAAHKWYETWVAKFRQLATRLSPEGEPVAMDADEDVLLRHLDTQDALDAIADSLPGYEERLGNTLHKGRMDVAILKCAALVAITEGRRRIQMSDYLIALEQSEEWVENLLWAVQATDLTPRAREVARLADLIRANGGRMEVAKIKRLPKWQGRSRDVDSLLEELLSQRVIDKLTPDAKDRTRDIVRIIEEAQ